MKKQNGITLIALVITIIVMLILVGVSVTVALNGGLFGTAEKAVEETKIKRDEEMALSDGTLKVGEQTYDSIYDYTNEEKVDNNCSHESFDVETDDECPDCGAEKITFTFANYPQVALEGMTWADWGAADWIYTSHGMWTIIIDNGELCVTNDGGPSGILGNIATSENVRVLPSDIITNGTTYVGEF